MDQNGTLPRKTHPLASVYLTHRSPEQGAQTHEEDVDGVADVDDAPRRPQVGGDLGDGGQQQQRGHGRGDAAARDDGGHEPLPGRLEPGVDGLGVLAAQARIVVDCRQDAHVLLRVGRRRRQVRGTGTVSTGWLRLSVMLLPGHCRSGLSVVGTKGRASSFKPYKQGVSEL